MRDADAAASVVPGFRGGGGFRGRNASPDSVQVDGAVVGCCQVVDTCVVRVGDLACSGVGC